MRIIMAIWWTLAVFWLSTHPLEAQSKSKKVRALEDWPTQVKGYGSDLDRAKSNAIEQLRKDTLAYLERKEQLPVAWKLTNKYVQENLLDGPGQQGEDAPLDQDGNVGLAKTWIYSLKTLDIARIAGLEEQAQRQLRVEDRLSLGFYSVVAAFVCLGGTSAFLITREWLKKRKLAAVIR